MRVRSYDETRTARQSARDIALLWDVESGMRVGRDIYHDARLSVLSGIVPRRVVVVHTCHNAVVLALEWH